MEQPVSITITEELHKVFAAKDEFDRHVATNHREHDTIRAEQKKDRDDNQLHVSARQKTLFDEIKSTRASMESKLDQKHAENSTRLNHVEKSIGGLEATTKGQNDQLTRMENTMRDMPGKIVADIVNAKKI